MFLDKPIDGIETATTQTIAAAAVLATRLIGAANDPKVLEKFLTQMEAYAQSNPAKPIIICVRQFANKEPLHIVCMQARRRLKRTFG